MRSVTLYDRIVSHARMRCFMDSREGRMRAWEALQLRQGKPRQVQPHQARQVRPLRQTEQRQDAPPR